MTARGPFVLALIIASLTGCGSGTGEVGAPDEQLGDSDGELRGGKRNTSTGSLTLKLLDSTDGLPHYGQRITFQVSTTATTEPYVRVDCYEAGVWVLSTSAGFFDAYPWPWTTTTTLAWDKWHTVGAESDCTATLYMQQSTTLATLKFHVQS